MIKEKKTLEVCVDTLDSALTAEDGGADRLELCANLNEGGTTPTYGLIELVKKRISLPVHVMIRPRRGDFVYSSNDFEVMKREIELVKEMGVEGVVFGILLPNSSIDKSRIKELVEMSKPLKITFHRAFDLVLDAFIALQELIDLKVDKILTSGGKASVLEGITVLSSLVEKSDNRISIMPGGGITDNNIRLISDTTKAKEFHVSGKKLMKGRMENLDNDLYFGTKELLNENEFYSTDFQKVKQIKTNLIN